MAFLKVLSCSLIFIIAAALFIDERMSIPKLDILYPQHYNINFVLNVNYDVFHGEYNVSIYIPYETENIYVYTENLTITRVRVTNDVQIAKENKEAFSHSTDDFIYDNEICITIISFPYNLSLGFYTLNIKFMGLLAENGGFRNYINQQNDRMWLAATHYYKFAIRRLFPLLKDTIYASYSISIKHHENFMALSNMPKIWEEIKVDGNNMQWTRFQITPVMPVYFIAAGVFNLFFITSWNTKLLCRKDILPYMTFAHNVAQNIAWFLPQIRKTKETNHIAIPELLNVEEIILGFVLYREEDIIFNEKIYAEIRKIEIARVIGYKVAHEWLYNAIDPYKWEPWLSKGFATYYGIYAVDQKFPDFRIQDFFVVQMQHDFLHWSTKDTWPLTIKSEFNSSFKVPRFIKASLMFYTLQTSSEKVFRKSIKRYLNYNYISSSDFWNEMQAVMSESSSKMKYKLEDKITNWTQLNYYPVINVERNYDKNSLNISVEDFNVDIWILNEYIDMNIVTETHLKNISIHVWLVPHISHIITDLKNENDSVLVNSQSGCYRVNYDARNWNRLSHYLNSKFFGKIHVLDRAKIIDDAFHFLMTGRLNSTVFLDILQYLRRDTDYIAWYPMFKNLEYISGFLAHPESAYSPIKKEMMESLIKLLWDIKYPDFKPNGIIQGSIFTKCLRQEAARWLCTLNEDYCFLVANYELKLYLLSYKNISSYKIWIGWKEWTFCNGLKTAGNDTWMQVYDIYLKESDNSILKFLTCSKDPSIILQYINIMTNMTITMDYINSYFVIVTRHARTGLFNFYNLYNTKPKEISYMIALTIFINHVYSKEEINKIKKYIAVFKYHTNPNLMINYEYYENGNMVRKSLPLTMNMITMYVNRKLELRWHQLKTQLYEYRYLIKDFDSVFKEFLAD